MTLVRVSVCLKLILLLKNYKFDFNEISQVWVKLIVCNCFLAKEEGGGLSCMNTLFY